MGKIRYIIKRIKAMDKHAMLRKVREIHKKTGKSKIYLFFDMITCAMKYGAGYMDYDLFEMYNLNSYQRDTYITRGRNNELVLKYCDKSYFHLFENKNEFNEVFSDYIKRDWISVKDALKENVIAFMERYSEFIAKPIDGACGYGIEKMNTKNYSSYEEIYKKLIEGNNNYEIEEIIKQHPEVSKIYPDSVNTVRVVTILKNGKAHIICTYLRIGNGKEIDNFNTGGIVAPVNEITGEVIGKGVDRNKNVYERHPKTGVEINGFKLPDWDKAMQMCKEAAKVIPQIGYVGWDVCFTPDGPALVEGNTFPSYDIYQLPEHTPDKMGMMPKFNI